MITNTFNLFIKPNTPVNKPKNIAFSAKEKQEAKNENQSTDDSRSFTVDMAFNNYLTHINKIDLISQEKEQELGKKINTGREIEEIISVYDKNKNLELQEKLIRFENIKTFLNRVKPKDAEAILKMAEEDEANEDIEKTILNGKKPTEFINEKNIQNEPVIIEIAEKIESFSSDKVMAILVKSLKDGYEAKALIKKVDNYKKEGKFTDKQAEQLKSGKIPSEINKKLIEAEKAQHELVLSYNRLVIKKAIRHMRDLEFYDAFGEGNVGLVVASKKFDYTKNVSFYNYAQECIKGYIQAANSRTANLIKIPMQRIKPMNDYFRAENDIFKETKKPATVEAIQEKTGFSPDEQQEIRRMFSLKTTTSLSHPTVEHKDNNPLIDMIPDKDAEWQDETTDRKYTSEKLKIIFSKLITDERTQKILELRLAKELTLEETANRLDTVLTKERVRQIEEAAVKGIKKQVAEYQEAQKLSSKEKRAILTKMKATLSRLEEQVVSTKLGLNSTDGQILSIRELQEIMKIPDLNHRKCFLGAMKKLEKAGMTEEDLRKCRKFTYIKELLKIQE